MPTLPTAANLGTALPRATRPVASYRGGIAEGAAYDAAASTIRTAARIGSAADEVLAAEQRIRDRNDTLNRVLEANKFTAEVEQELQAFQNGADAASPEAVAALGTSLRNKMDSYVEAHQGSEDSKIKLLERLDSIRSAYGSSVAQFSQQAQQKLLSDSVTKGINGLSAQVTANPGAIEKSFNSLDAMIDDLAPAMTADTERASRAAGRSEIVKSAATSLIDRGAWADARRLLSEDQGLINYLSPADQRIINGSIARAEQTDTQARMAGQRKVEEVRQILGREPNPAERLRLAGVAPSAADQSPSQKIEAIETAIGRPLSADERLRAVNLAPTAATLSDVASMRKEFNALSAPFRDTRDSFGRVQASMANASPAGDMALIYNFMKMLDPGSVVREGEFATAQNAGSVPDRVRSLYNRIASGERLAPDQRADFVSRAEDLFLQAQNTQRALEGQYRGIAERSGLKPDDVVVDFNVGQAPRGTTSTPRIQYDLQGNRIGGGNARN